MTQQVIDIGSAPDDATGDPLRTSFDKTNENFTELYAKGATEGLWNYNKTSSDTSTAPVSGRFKTNSGNYRDATQIAINATTIQGIDRSSTLRTLLVGDLIQCQDKSNAAAWCRYSLLSLPVDHTTWFQLNVALEADGGVASGDNQEIIFVFTASSGGGSVDLSAYATLASPTFTGDPQAPTPPTTDNDNSVATTAFVKAAVAAASGGGTSQPQGRLTLQAATPVMTATQAAKTKIYYTPYVGNTLPIYDGTSFAMTTFAELSVLTTDTTKSPAAIGVSKVNDWFVWSDAGTLRLGHGPDWTNDTTRSAGTALVLVNGIWLNNAAITNGPAARRGTYVGTTRSNPTSELNWIFGGLAANGALGFFGVWNTYNRVLIMSQVRDSTDSWTLAAITVQPANNSSTMRVSYVCGIAEDAFQATYSSSGSTGGSGGYFAFGIGYDSTTVFSGTTGFANPSTGVNVIMPSSGTFVTTSLGYHFLTALETMQAVGTGTFFGDANSPGTQNGLTFSGML